MLPSWSQIRSRNKNDVTDGTIQSMFQSRVRSRIKIYNLYYALYSIPVSFKGRAPEPDHLAFLEPDHLALLEPQPEPHQNHAALQQCIP
jgi:hypothetical protein